MAPPPEVHSTTRWLKGIFFTLLLFFSAFWGSVFYLGPLMPLLLAAIFTRDSHPTAAQFFLRSFRFLTDHIVGTWLSLPPSLLYLLFNQETKMFGDRVIPGESALFIMNHRTRLDWMFLWSPLMAFGTLNQLKVILKNILKMVPGVGWAMQLNNFIFLHRKWDKDEAILTRMLAHTRAVGRPTQLLLFPEGTDFEPRTKERSDNFARKNNLPIYDYVLHPRTTGFSFCVHRMVANKQIDAIYDVTIAYPKSVLQNEFGMVTGAVPEEIHFNIHRYSLQQLDESIDLTSEQEISNWCNERWKEKEENLAHFYSAPNSEDRKFVGSPHPSPSDNHRPTDNGRSSTAFYSQLNARMWLSAIFWTVSVALQFYLFATTSLCFYYSLFIMALLTAATVMGGLEIIESGIIS